MSAFPEPRSIVEDKFGHRESEWDRWWRGAGGLRGLPVRVNLLTSHTFFFRVETSNFVSRKKGSDVGLISILKSMTLDNPPRGEQSR